jgi:hypothetical protein
VPDRSDEVIDHHCFDLSKIRVPAVIGHRIFAGETKGELGSRKLLPTAKLVSFLG